MPDQGLEGLPSERVLAERLKVSRPTLRVVLERMEGLGLIHRLPSQSRLVRRPGAEPHLVVNDTVVVFAPVNSPLHFPAGSQDQADSSAQMAFFRKLRKAGIPVICQGPAAAAGPCDSVESDHEAGGYLLTRWLIARGRRRILRVWPRSSPSARVPNWLAERGRGHERAMREAGLPVRPVVWIQSIQFADEPASNFHQQVRFAAGHLVEHLAPKQGVDALMTVSDGPSFQIAAAAQMVGRQPHDDLAIVGYDNDWAEASERAFEATLPLATVDKGNAQIGRALVETLERRRAEGPDTAPIRRLIEPTVVVPGEVSESLAVSRG